MIRRSLARLVLFATALALPLAPSFAQDEGEAAFEELLAPVTQQRAWRDSRTAVQVVDVATGEVVFTRDADRGLIPASTMKAVTAAAALSSLGPSYKFKTTVHADGGIDSVGTLHGDLYIEGGGDPTFVVEKLWKLVYDLKIDGLTKIDGDVVFDESFFAGPYPLQGWDKKEDVERGPSYFSRQSALSLNFNTVAIVVAPGAETGGGARVQLETPASPYVEVVNEVVTGESGSYRRLSIEREVADDGHMVFTVTGSMPSGAAAARYYRTVEDPTAHFQAAFLEMANRHGIAVTGRGRRGVTPPDTRTLWELNSPPLASILMDMNKYSNNFMAEQVLRTMGAEANDGQAGDTEAGLAVVRDYLTSIGVPQDSYTIVNGSGLSRDSSIPPSLLTAVLLDMAADTAAGGEFRSSLAIAGADGTLWKRLRDEPGRVRGKTGTIDGVHCLTGYAESADGALYAFAFLSNNIRGGISQVKKLHDAMARELIEVDGTTGALVEASAASPGQTP